MFHVYGISPMGERFKMGLGQRQLQHALDDRDDLRAAYLRSGSKWDVIVEDGDGVLMDWDDLETNPVAGEAA